MTSPQQHSHPGTLNLGFLGGVGVMLLAITIGSWLITYILILIQVGPVLPWVPVDKNIGFDAAFKGLIGGNILGLAVLAVISSARRDAKPLLGGLAVFASEFVLVWALLTPGIV